MKNLDLFLEESNKIEGVYDDDSLKQAKYAWEYLIKQKKLTIGVILKTHKILMLHQKLLPNQKGYFREVTVFIGSRELMNYREIRKALEVWLNDVKTSVQVPGKDGNNIKLDHITYESIHPFIDGNGRTGRMFMNWQRVKSGLPILVINADERQSYYEWFK